MADTDPTQVPVEINTDKLNNSISSLNGAIDKFSSVLSALPNAGGSLGITNVQSQLELVEKSAKKMGNSINLTNSSISSLQDAFSKINLNSAMGELRKFEKTPVFGSLAKQFSDMLGFMSKNSEKFKDILAGGALVAGAEGAKKIFGEIDKATGLFTAEKNLRELQRTTMQINTALEGVRSGAEVNFNAFNRSLKESMVLTKTSKDDVMALKRALGEAFGVEQMDTVLRVSDAMDNFKGALTATNAALLISKATGMEVGNVAGFMSDAVLQLGENVDSATLAFGRIQQSAEKSGIGFGKTLNAIKSSTENLKMWGGTIGAVSPLFDMFSRSLSAGQKGLAPELLQKFAGGLQNMTMGVKGFLGLRAGMGGAGGAIGAGLEIEEAMSKGPEGMKKVVDSLTQTLGQLGGGRILTRTEAIRDPTTQANFLMQRQLLGKLVGLDEASATKTLDALSKIQQGGLDITDESNKNFAQLIGMGEKVAQETTDPMLEVMTKVEAAELEGSKKIIEAIGGLGAKLDISQSIKGLMNALDRSIISGQIDPADYMKEINRAMREKDTAKERVNEMRQSGRAPTNTQLGRLDRAGKRENELRVAQQMFEGAAEKIVKAVQTESLTPPETVALNVAGKVPDRMVEDLISEFETQDKNISDNIKLSMREGVNVNSKAFEAKLNSDDLSRIVAGIEAPTMEAPKLPQKMEQEINRNAQIPQLPRRIEQAANRNVQMPRLQTLNVENLSVANLARDLINNANLKSNSPQVSAAINATGATRREIATSNIQNNNNQNFGKINADLGEFKLKLSLEMDNNGNIKIAPIVGKIIAGEFKYNRET